MDITTDRIELVNDKKSARVFAQDLVVQPDAEVLHFSMLECGLGCLVIDIPAHDAADYEGVGFYDRELHSWVITNQDETVLDGVQYRILSKYDERFGFQRLKGHEAMVKEVEYYIKTKGVSDLL